MFWIEISSCFDIATIRGSLQEQIVARLCATKCGTLSGCTWRGCNGNLRTRLKERVEWARKTRGWNQEFIADHLGVSRRRLNNWLNTPREPTMETYAELCRLLEMNAGYCLGLTDNPEPTTATEELQQINVKVDQLLKKQV